jgi:Tol biopolymer transport system component/DNA-binding winged helix-turn-helix (wHTH) protein
MATQSRSRARFAFGPFALDVSAGELRRNGTRIRLSGQPLQILLTLLEHPGDVVTRDQLRQKVWAETTFVDFEHGLNAAMNKLRRALSDSAENPRYIETVPGRGYRFIATLQPDPQAQIASAQPEPEVPILSSYPVPRKHSERRSVGIRWWVTCTALFACVSFALGWLFHRSPSSLSSWNLTQLTADPGFSHASALSADGKLVAYSSDRGLNGERDLYIKQVAGGQPIRLTFDGQGNTAPDFSPDGSRIVFRSDRDGGGIYEIPAFGGEARLLARNGLNPRFSPDGAQVAYWIGDENIANVVPGSGAVWIVAAAGGQSRQLGQVFTAARYPVWSPDAKHLLVVGYTSKKAYESSAIDWWLVDIDGGPPKRTGAYDAFVRAGFHARDFHTNHPATPFETVARPSCWLTTPSRVVFSIESGDTGSLWEAEISTDSGQLTGVFRRLTAGAGYEVEPSCAAGDLLVFTNVEARSGIWSMQFDSNSGKPPRSIERITQSLARREYVSLSSDGRYATFAAAQSGPFNICLRELATGDESHVASSPFTQTYPVMNATGSKIAFSVYGESAKRSVYLFTRGRALEELCVSCLRATDWSHDERSLLIFGGDPYQISSLDVESRRQTVLLRHPIWNLLYGHFSPDNHWVSFSARTQPNRAQIMIAPIDGPKPVPESAWIKIADGGGEDWADWSPDGKTLYFTSQRDGHFCLWGQRIEPGSHRVAGAPFPVQHFHGSASYQQGGWSAEGGRIAIVLAENTGNIWMMSRTGGH